MRVCAVHNHDNLREIHDTSRIATWKLSLYQDKITLI